MEPRGQGIKGDEAQDTSKTTSKRMFIPLETIKMRYGEVLMRRRTGSFEAERVQLHEVTVKVAKLDQVMNVADAIKQALEYGHKKKDFEIVVPLELLKRAERTKQIFNIVLGSIAAISLLVGGIGIMNIMLASVTERTREIGIRRALGARRHDIVMQFLVETVLLSGAGGIIGVLLGVAIPFIVTWTAGMKTIITLWSPLLAFSISALVGVVFGIYPAIRAAEMDPVEALRHE
jgi:putative ABC transport system permease protein